ncbi:MAG: PAS domain-containing protein [Prevotellaceae bacterium]|nr:PAS domain-containing protein [Prevotellaceae bacterium]
MFKSIQYKTALYTSVLIVITVAITLSVVYRRYELVVFCAMLFFIFLLLLNKSYKKYNRNILFLLNALENGDYSFHFAETKLSTNEKELNVMMNRIKDILSAARKEVIENEKFLSLIVESVSTGIIIVDDRDIVQNINQAALDLLGLPVFTHIKQLRNINETTFETFRALKSGKRAQVTVANEREEQQIALQASDIRLRKGNLRVVTMNSIGNELENKEMESWIKLIRVMTHEIMNSIAPISSLSDTLLFMLKDDSTERSDELKENTIEAFETISTTASGLLSFVESYRKFTAMPKPEKHHFELKKLLEEIVKLHEIPLKEKGIQATIRMDNADTLLYADKKLVAQALVNLVRNAIESIDRPDGKLILTVELPNKNNLSIHVENNGKPIPKETLPNIFVPFFTTKEKGSGIGLSVSRYIMRLHGGKLQHALSSGGNTVFSLYF